MAIEDNIQGSTTNDNSDNVSTSKLDYNDQALSTTNHIEDVFTSPSEQEDMHQDSFSKHDTSIIPGQLYLMQTST